MMGDTPFSVTFHNQHGEARGSRDGLPVLYSRKFVKSGDHHGIIINNNRTMLPNGVSLLPLPFVGVEYLMMASLLSDTIGLTVPSRRASGV